LKAGLRLQGVGLREAAGAAAAEAFAAVDDAVLRLLRQLRVEQPLELLDHALR